jgi:hypothetical protein
VKISLVIEKRFGPVFQKMSPKHAKPFSWKKLPHVPVPLRRRQLGTLSPFANRWILTGDKIKWKTLLPMALCEFFK